MLAIIPFVLLGYLVGGIPTAYLLGKRLRDVDIRGLGSRNIGTLNAYKHLGWRIGIAVFAADVGKGAVVMLMAMAWDLSDWGLFTVALATAIGNNWSPYLRFQGGKGLAVVFGISLAVIPLLALLAVPAALVGFALTRGLVWAFFLGMIAVNVGVAVAGESASVIVTCLVLTWLVIVTHFAKSFPEIKAAVVKRDPRGFGQVE
jgi:glycerol-3-phosphate acyltransferase PlsY